jgi:hypothetical protein
VLTTAATQQALADFTRWVSTHCAVNGRAGPDRTAGPLTTRQFRRTLAWFIARHPGGAIAGAIQYRHHAIQMFEDYAGTSSSGFRAEVESEQAIARGEHLLAMIDQHEHQQMTGPAAAEAAGRLASFAGQVATDPRRLARLMARHDPAIYPGKYVTCIYSHAKALCTRGAGPDLGSCRPLECRNAAFTAANRDAFRGELASIDASLARIPALPPYLQHTLARRREAIAAFLTGRPEEPE